MPTFGVSTKIEMSTEKARVDFGSFYKSFSNQEVSIKDPVNILATEYKDIDLSNSNFFVVMADTYGLDNEVLQITLTDSLANTFVIENLSFLFLNCSNLTNLRITNTDSTKAVDAQVIY